MSKSMDKYIGSRDFKETARRCLLILAAIIVLAAIGQIASKYAPDASGTSKLSTNSNLGKTVSYSGEEGKSVYELLVAKHKVESQQTEIGTFVTAIDGTANVDSSFWIYYVNGQPGTVTSDTHKTNAGDRVEWRYEQFQ